MLKWQQICERNSQRTVKYVTQKDILAKEQN